MENYTYIIADKEAGQAFVIDPSGPAAQINAELKKEGLEMKGILLTHGHYDHVVDVDTYDVPVYLSTSEAPFYTPKAKKLTGTADGYLFDMGAFTVKCLHTPGHTPGGQCFIVNDNLFTGDTLFMDAVGRTDFPGGDSAALFHSLQKIKALPDSTVVWPGHHYGVASQATLGSLKKHNLFLICEDVEKFTGYLR